MTLFTYQSIGQRTAQTMAVFHQAEYYENNSTLQRKHGLDLITKIAPVKGSNVLDLGCGTGFLTKTLADLVGPEGKVVGIDPDQERLKIAREKYPANNIRYLEGRAESIPGDLMYDYIFSNFVLHYCENKDKVLEQVGTRLKQGGKFGFTCQNQDIMTNNHISVMSPKLLAAIAAKLHYTEWGRLSQIAASKPVRDTGNKIIHNNN